MVNLQFNIGKYLIIVISLLVISCTKNNKTENQISEELKQTNEHIPKLEAVKLNDSAISLISQTMMFQDSANEALYKNALSLLNKAIQLDSLYELAYSNKVDVLKKLGQYQEAIKTLQKASFFSNDFAESIAGQGFLYEKINCLDSADIKYNEALKAYANRLKKEPKNIDTQINLAFIIIFTHNKNDALDEIDNIINTTNSQQAKDFRIMIKDFDRDQFIDNF